MNYSTKQEKALVLNVIEKSEHNALIKIMTEDKILYLLVKGYYKKDNKNRHALQKGYTVFIEYFLNYKFKDQFLLKKATVCNVLSINNENYYGINKLFILFSYIEIGSKNFLEFYDLFLLEQDFEHTNYLETYLIYEILKLQGRKLEFQKCAICLSKVNLASYNFNEGGMLCLKHKRSNDIAQVEILKSLFLLDRSYLEYKKNVSLSIDQFINRELISFLWK